MGKWANAVGKVRERNSRPWGCGRGGELLTWAVIHRSRVFYFIINRPRTVIKGADGKNEERKGTEGKVCANRTLLRAAGLIWSGDGLAELSSYPRRSKLFLTGGSDFFNGPAAHRRLSRNLPLTGQPFRPQPHILAARSRVANLPVAYQSQCLLSVDMEAITEFNLEEFT